MEKVVQLQKAFNPEILEAWAREYDARTYNMILALDSIDQASKEEGLKALWNLKYDEVMSVNDDLAYEEVSKFDPFEGADEDEAGQTVFNGFRYTFDADPIKGVSIEKRDSLDYIQSKDENLRLKGGTDFLKNHSGVISEKILEEICEDPEAAKAKLKAFKVNISNFSKEEIIKILKALKVSLKA